MNRCLMKSGHSIGISSIRIDSIFQRKDGRLATARTVDVNGVFVDYLFATSRIEPEVVDVPAYGSMTPLWTRRHIRGGKHL